MHIKIYWSRINIQRYILVRTIFHNISIDTNKLVRGGITSQHSMLDFKWDNTASPFKILQWILPTLMLAPMIYPKGFNNDVEM